MTIESGTVVWRLPDTRTSGAVAGDGLPELSGSAPGMLPEVLPNAKRPRAD
jgi:hypothetical protein